jgi:predicted nuclease of predicted toxin-antitoxin system
MFGICCKINTSEEHLSSGIMRFVVDAQLPKSLSDLINSKGYDSIHTLDLPKANATQDHEILELCIRENRVVMTKDNDFLDSYLLIEKLKN